jgi:formamidopyrimidine-DNA glycosylase
VPELPEVEVLVRHLRPLLAGKTVVGAHVFRPKVLLPTTVEDFRKILSGGTFVELGRRGKYLIFLLKGRSGKRRSVRLLGHLGMTGRIYLFEKTKPLPKHTAVVLDLGTENLVFEDTRYFGRLTLDTSALDKLGPEPLERRFTAKAFAQALQRSDQAIKVKLLDQSLIAGVGNIYASEALFLAGISPRLPARRLNLKQVRKLRLALRSVLARAIRCGSTVPLNYDGVGGSDGLFYFGRVPGAPDFYEERLQVYDRARRPCPKCGTAIRRIVQAARSTFYCPKCQRLR